MFDPVDPLALRNLNKAGMEDSASTNKNYYRQIITKCGFCKFWSCFWKRGAVLMCKQHLNVVVGPGVKNL